MGIESTSGRVTLRDDAGHHQLEVDLNGALLYSAKADREALV